MKNTVIKVRQYEILIQNNPYYQNYIASRFIYQKNIFVNFSFKETMPLQGGKTGVYLK